MLSQMVIIFVDCEFNTCSLGHFINCVFTDCVFYYCKFNSVMILHFFLFLESIMGFLNEKRCKRLDDEEFYENNQINGSFER